MLLSTKRFTSRILERTKFAAAISVLVFTALYTVIDFFLTGNAVATAAAKSHWEIFGEILFHALVVLGLGTIIGFLLEAWQGVTAIRESVEELTVQNEQLEEAVLSMKKHRHSFETKEMRLFIKQHRDETIGELLEKWHEELEDALNLSLSYQRFTVEHELQALRSYQLFWELLVAEQRSRKKDGKEGLTALIVHSSSLEIWSKYAIGNVLLGSQGQFCTNGGTAIRILCGQGKPSTECIKVAKDMKDKGIEVYYHDIAASKTGFDFSWDFLYVKETQAAVIWESFSPGARIITSTYQIGKMFRGYDLEALWQSIREDKENTKPIGND